ncbi:hypothetical protein BCR42DRAFT_402801 [Absidia repens]|uniref:Uncharacterized protein n=1 Tax=Absidia repens TaxID=90262 RepID=A0A1X2J069_9FUNG|nr:hypothetical protein BCR42DRAFT_402801 [Absidia repens]
MMPLSPTPTTISTPTPKHQEKYNAHLRGDEDDDDIALAKCMTRKLQLNQQMYPWMSPRHQQHDSPTSRDSASAINNPALNRYSYTQYHQLQLHLQHQQQLMLHYQQQQNLAGFGQSLGHHHHHHRHYQQQHIPSIKQQPIIRKSKSSQLDAQHDSKSRISRPNSTYNVSYSSLSNPPSSPTKTSKKDSRHHRNSLLFVQSDIMTKTHHPQHRHRQKQQHEFITPKPLVENHIPAHRSSIYSHESAISSSAASASNWKNTTVELTQSSASISVTKPHRKPSLSKRIRGVIMNGGTDKQIHTALSPSSLRRSSSLISSTSSTIIAAKAADDGHGTSRSLWTSLFRKSSRSGPEKYVAETQLELGKRTKGQKGVVPDSPASSVSERSYHRPFLHQDNDFADNLPSPVSSTSPESPLNYSADQQYYVNHLDPSQRSEPSGQLDYFGLPSQQHTGTSPYTFLQHVSPKLQPSSNNQQQNRSALSVPGSDDLPTCLLEAAIPNNNNNNSPAILLPPILSASTSASSLELDHQQSNDTKPTIKSRSAKPNMKIQFASAIQVHDTFGSQDYDRRCDTQVTWQRLTTVLALQIKKELNEYKLNEMQVHLQSRQNTQFFM